MKTKSTKLRLAVATATMAVAAMGATGLTPAAAQGVPDDLTVMPAPSDDYQPSTTAWGDPDFRGTFPIDNIASLPMQRQAQYGDRFWLTEEEYAQRENQGNMFSNLYDQEDEQGKIGMGHWVESSSSGRRTSLLVDPADGQLPAFTEFGQEKYSSGRSSWVNGQDFDWVTDFDSWDRCVSRGFPASMLPFRYNNGIRVYQSPGHVVIDLEMIHDSRVIPVVSKDEWDELQKTRWDEDVRTWMGQSLGYWEDHNTLVIVTTNIKAGDSTTRNAADRAASPLNMATMGVPPNNTIPTSKEAKVVERLSMVGPNSITYEMTYSDPVVWTAPWTARLDWTRNEDYGFFEYACHEGNVQVRNYINSSRAGRGLSTSKIGVHSSDFDYTTED